MTINGIQLIAGFGLAVLVAILAYLARSLNRSGMVAAIILGTVIFGLGGWNWAILLLTFFISSSLLSKIFKRRKQTLDEKFEKGSQRDAGQVAANGGIAGLCVLLQLAFPGGMWPWLAFAGSLAAVNADTWATELGVLNRKPPRLITSGKVVDPGTSGGVSLVGNLAAMSGALLVAFFAVVFWPRGQISLTVPQSFLWLLVITFAGTAGSLVDSLLGATLQAIYTCPSCQKETERHPLHTCGTPTIHVRGVTWLNNDWVNTSCALSGALLAGIVGMMLVSNQSTQSISQTQFPPFQLSSPAFKMGEPIPVQYTCSGTDQSPELLWNGYPIDTTRSLALVMQDPDAPVGVFTHWVIYNIPPGINNLPAGIPVDPQDLVTATQGKNSFGHPGYNGPCPPAGKVHRYFFTLYALNSSPDLEAGMDIQKLQPAIKDHILAQAQWMGTYGH